MSVSNHVMDMTLIILDMINFDVTVEIKELAKNHAHSYLGNSV